MNGKMRGRILGNAGKTRRSGAGVFGTGFGTGLGTILIGGLRRREGCCLFGARRGGRRR
jgi:hypothetical protein